MKKVLGTLLIITFMTLQNYAAGDIKLNQVYKTPSGLQYKYTKLGSGKQASAGDKVKVHYTGKLTNDTVFDSSVKRNQPFEFKLGAGQVIKGWDEGIALMKIGDKLTLTIPAELGYGSRDMGTIPPNSTLVFDVELLDISEGVKPYDVKGKEAMKTSSGLQYYILSKGNGAKPQPGDMVKVHYTGYLESGKVFDSSVERGEPIEFQVGKGQVIKGWDEGLMLLNVGDKARLEIPYYLAYGDKAVGNGIIPAKSNLIFDVELVSTKSTPKPVPYVSFTDKTLDTIKTTSGLKYIKVKAGEGAKAESGKFVKVHYTGYLPDGTIFDSSIERDMPIVFKLGARQVIEGWDEGIALMKIGERMRLIVPYNLGYGENGYGPIPPKATLIFDVELINVGDSEEALQK